MILGKEDTMDNGAMRVVRPRYVVKDANGAALRETNSRIIAWLAWRRNRAAAAVAYDRMRWFEDDKSWLRMIERVCAPKRDLRGEQ